MFPPKPCIGLVSLLATAACSSQAETDYRGEPLATVHGRVSNPLDLASEDDLVAAVAWVSHDEGMKAISSPVAVEGAFPGEFSITLYEPPPEEALVDTRSQDQALAPIAWGRIVALRAGDVGQATTWDAVQGISLDGAVAYVREVAEGSADQEVVETQAAYYKFSPDPGFKLIAIERPAPEDWVPCGSLGLCVERVGGSELDAGPGRPSSASQRRIAAGVLRSARQQRLSRGPGESLRPGDALQFTVSAPRSGYLAVLSRDGSGQSSVYYPEGERAARVEAGEQVLPQSTVLDDVLGHERLHAVLCEQSFELQGALERVAEGRGAPLAGPGCSVDTIEIEKVPQ